MADSNHIRRAEFDFADNDPFAELTRIMGHDPRPAAEPSQPVAEVDAALENELARSLDFHEFDEPSADAETAASGEGEYDPAPVMADDVPAWDAPGEPGNADDAEPLELAIEEDFTEAFAQELQVRTEAQPEAVVADEPADTVPEPVELAVEPEPFMPVSEPETMSEEPLQVENEAVEPAVEQVHDLEAAAPEPEPELVDFEEIEAELVEAPRAEIEAAAPQPVSEAPNPVFADEISLEDELNALLAGTSPTAPVQAPTPSYAAAPYVQREVETAPVAVASAAPTAPAAEAWRPSVQTFGRANFPAPRPPLQAAVAAPVIAAAAPVLAAAPEPVVEESEPELEADAFVEPAPEAEEFQEPEFEADFAEADTFEEAVEPVAEDAVEPAYEDRAAAIEDEAGFADLLGDLELNLDVDEVDAHFEQPVVARADSYSFENDAVADQEEQPAVAESADDDTPAIETIEVIEGAVAMTDDLEIPDIDYGTPAPRIYDELENEFDQAFGELSLDEPAPQPAEPAPEPFDWGAMAPADPAQPMPYAPSQAADEWQAPLQDADEYEDEYEYEADLKQAIAMSAYEEDEPEQPAPRRRGLVVAAFVAAVAVVGGAGVFGMSIFGGGSDGPALLLADSDPMKVRPENPGGTTVPNQDNEVYQRVAGGAAASRPPAQERLITTAEEPVDISGEEEDVAMLPSGISEGDEPAAMSEQPLGDDTEAADPTLEAATQPKSEERIEQDAEQVSPGGALSGDLAVVTPRRVRTMVVRPDGSMVPREEPTPAPAEQASPMVVASVPVTAAPALAPVAGQAPVTAEDEGGPDVVTPDQVSVLPGPRIEPEIEPFDVIPPAEPAIAVERPEPMPALAPATAAAAAAGAWSMQIASQPTAEGAQSTYQDLARRYGNVLQGRGVNIVRANIAGKGVYYRVRIPASTRDEAIQLCTRYKSAGGSCFVSR